MWLGAPGGAKYSDGNGIIIDLNNGTANGTALGRTLVSNNVSFNNGGGGVQVTGADHVDVLNNTTYMNSASVHLQYGQIGAYDSNDVNVVNNILYAPTATGGNPAEPVNTASLSTVRWAYNLYYGGNIAPITGTGDRTGNPLFLDPANGYFKLAAGSPAINHGTTSLASATGFAAVTTPTTTIDDLLRSTYGVPDMGAFEYTG